MSARSIDPEGLGLDTTLGSVEELNSGSPHPARVYDYFLGGRMHFAADRAAARAIQEINPHTAFACQQSRLWIHKAVGYVVRQGVEQILDIGTGIPTSPNVHEVAQRINRRARVVYLDNDPIVLHLARTLLESTEEGRTAYVQADFLQGTALFDLPQFNGPDPVIDLKRPVALSINSLVHFVPGQVAYDLVGSLMERLAPGSFLVLSSLTADFAPEVIGRAMRSYSSNVIPVEPRSKEQIERFFEGMELVDPGVVAYPLWRARAEDVIPPLHHVNGYCGVGRLAN
jgi:O-methyltransferase involved in polyketide biosynthesis